MKKSRVAYILDSEITELELMLQRATLILRDLQEDYLDSKLSGQFLEHYQHSASIRGEIIADYLYRLSDKVQELCALANEKEMKS